MSKKQPIRVISLFDGMSCGQIALKELGYEVQYYASEIDKHAIAQTQLNFPDTIQLGDVTKWREWDIDWNFDLLLAGSPCQGFSFAGKQLAFNDPRSKLFFVFVDILNHIRKVNPDVKFLLENVRMKAEHEAVITQYTGVNPIYINSALVSAQNRERIYWTNIGMVQRGLFGEWYPGIPQPEDRGILLRDILESEVSEKYYLNNKALERIDRKIGFVPQVNPDKTGTLNTCNNSGRLSFDNGTTLVGVLNDRGQIRETKQSTCIDSNYWKGMDNHAQRTMIVAMRGRNPETPSDRTTGAPTEQRLEPNLSGKTNCLTSVQKDNLLLIPEATIKGYVEIAEGECFDFENPNSKTRRGRKMEDKSNCLMAQPTTNFMRYEGVQKDNLVMQLNPSKESGGVQPYQQNRVYDPNGISPCLNTDARPHAIVELNDNQQGKFNPNVDTDKHNTVTMAIGRAGSSSEYMDSVSKVSKLTGRIRRLTPIECSRLQTIPSWYKWNCSDTQAYKMLGNGWTVEVIKHILKYLTI